MGIFFQILVEKDVYMVLCIVDESEGADTARLQAKVLIHTPFRGEAELALMKDMLQIVNPHCVIALEYDQIVAVALMVTEE